MADLISINPATGEVVGTYPEMTVGEVEVILEKAQTAFLSWRRLAIKERCQYFKHLGQILRARKNEFSRLMALEMGKPLEQGTAEIEKCAWVCEYYADHAKTFLSPRNISSDASESYVSFQPLGIILAIMPWNFPFWQVFRFAAPTMIAGNGAILKHASNVQGCADSMEGVFLEAGFPPDVFRSLTIRSNKVDEVIEHSCVKAVTLTGSTIAGQAVAKKAGSVLKKTVLELGGSDPYIILKDADLVQAVTACITGRLLNAGQSCIAAKRFIVERSIKDEFIDRIVKITSEKIVGDPFEKGVELGPMVNVEARSDLHSQVERSIRKGAKLILGGKVPDGPGAFYPVTVLINVKPGMPAFDEELFGPVAVIISARDEEEAVALANQTSFGLGAAVFTSDMEKGRKIAEEKLEVGAAFVNDFVRSDPRLPFGGVKASGYGRELSSFGILEFVNVKTIYIR